MARQSDYSQDLSGLLIQYAEMQFLKAYYDIDLIAVHIRKIPLVGNFLADEFLKFCREIYVIAMRQFVPDGEIPFQDFVWRSLPMDNTVSDDYLKVIFTELWVPIAQCSNLMQSLKNFFHNNWTTTNYFSFELYIAKKSDFWLSPSYEYGPL